MRGDRATYRNVPQPPTQNTGLSEVSSAERIRR